MLPPQTIIVEWRVRKSFGTQQHSLCNSPPPNPFCKYSWENCIYISQIDRRGHIKNVGRPILIAVVCGLMWWWPYRAVCWLPTSTKWHEKGCTITLRQKCRNYSTQSNVYHVHWYINSQTTSRTIGRLMFFDVASSIN